MWFLSHILPTASRGFQTDYFQSLMFTSLIICLTHTVKPSNAFSRLSATYNKNLIEQLRLWHENIRWIHNDLVDGFEASLLNATGALRSLLLYKRRLYYTTATSKMYLEAFEFALANYDMLRILSCFTHI